MAVGCKLSKDDESKAIDTKYYRSMIGTFLYVTASRPDVKQAVGMVARFQAERRDCWRQQEQIVHCGLLDPA
jgi:hypothetical protein